MTDETEHRFLRLSAETAALRAVVFAIIDLHPDKPRLSAHLVDVTDFLMSQWLNSEIVSDELTLEFQQQMEALQKRCRLP